jgi:hypothetical protein
MAEWKPFSGCKFVRVFFFWVVQTAFACRLVSDLFASPGQCKILCPALYQAVCAQQQQAASSRVIGHVSLD